MNRNGRLITFGVFFASLAVFSLARSRFVSLSATGTAQALLLAGDEPAYLMLTHSLATDGDFNLYNNCLNRDGRFFGREQSGGHAARKDREEALDWYNRAKAIYAELEAKGQLSAVSAQLRLELADAIAQLNKR